MKLISFKGFGNDEPVLVNVDKIISIRSHTASEEDIAANGPNASNVKALVEYEGGLQNVILGVEETVESIVSRINAN